MTILEKLNILMDSKELNKNNLASELGVPKQNIYNWFNRGCENMALSSFKRLCSFFGVTMDSMAWDDREIEYIKDRNPDSLSRKEQEMIEMYGKISDEGKQIVDSALKGAYEIAMEKKEDTDIGNAVAIIDGVRERGA